MVVVVTVDIETGRVLTGPEIITRGWVYAPEAEDLLDEACDRVASGRRVGARQGRPRRRRARARRAQGGRQVRGRADQAPPDDRARRHGGLSRRWSRGHLVALPRLACSPWWSSPPDAAAARTMRPVGRCRPTPRRSLLDDVGTGRRGGRDSTRRSSAVHRDQRPARAGEPVRGPAATAPSWRTSTGMAPSRRRRGPRLNRRGPCSSPSTASRSTR